LRVFARKPAPIQVTAWGYIGGSGMKAMDVFLADPVVVPPEEKKYYAERICYLPSVISAFFPDNFPPVGPLPALSVPSHRGGEITFGSFNRLAKISAEAYRTWAQVLQAIPGSRMLLKTPELDCSDSRDRILGCFTQAGIDPARITLLGGSSWPDHMAVFNAVDISLDPYPHGGGVTALEGLMMGVPVVTLRWPTIPGRVSASILTTLGLSDWIAETPQQYVEIATRKAGDLKALAELRQQLRPRFLSSIIGDTTAYARVVEQEYRKLWREWSSHQRADCA
jgi:predicted O-linked N-acetylglucosamine transferase (SPINDLY family)